MIEPNETPAPRSKHLIPGAVTANAAPPSTAAHGGPTREGHSNGLRVHAIVFGSISLAVFIVLATALIFIASGRM